MVCTLSWSASCGCTISRVLPPTLTPTTILEFQAEQDLNVGTVSQVCRKARRGLGLSRDSPGAALRPEYWEGCSGHREEATLR